MNNFVILVSEVRPEQVEDQVESKDEHVFEDILGSCSVFSDFVTALRAVLAEVARRCDTLGIEVPTASVVNTSDGTIWKFNDWWLWFLVRKTEIGVLHTTNTRPINGVN